MKLFEKGAGKIYGKFYEIVVVLRHEKLGNLRDSSKDEIYQDLAVGTREMCFFFVKMKLTCSF